MAENIELVEQDDEGISVFVHDDEHEMLDGRILFREDVKIRGCVWRVHQNDPDPFPSNPHAHCLSGRFEGQKAHLGNGELYKGNQQSGWKLSKKAFSRLCEFASKKFPESIFPIPNDEEKAESD